MRNERVDDGRRLLSVIIVNYNAGQWLRKAVDSVYAAAADLGPEVFIVDNGSADGSLDPFLSPGMRERYPDLFPLPLTSNVGFGAANNLGIHLARGEFVLLLNPDAELTRGAVQSLIAYLDSHPAVGAVGPELRNTDGTLQLHSKVRLSVASYLLQVLKLSQRYPRSKLWGYPMRAHFKPLPTQVDWVNGACILARTSVLRSVGGFDEDFFLYCEEVDLCHRIRASGRAVAYLPQALVYHHCGKSVSQNPGRRVYWTHSGKLLHFQKHYHPLRCLAFRAVLLVECCAKAGLLSVAALMQSDAASARSRRQGYLDFLKSLLGMKRSSPSEHPGLGTGWNGGRA